MIEFKALENYGRKHYSMKSINLTIAELKVAAYKEITEKCEKYARIKLLSTTSGVVEEFENLDSFMQSDLNEHMDVELLDINHALIYNEEIQASEWNYIFVIREIE